MDKEKQIHAVWMTLFSRLGDVAFYDSHSNVYIIKASSNYKSVEKIYGKSLLCFSPSGKHIAFSDQRYISYKSCPMGSWGHQPSSNIYIYSVDNLQCALESFNDFGVGLRGAAPSSRMHSVAAAAFSQDEKRLLAIGEDGVVVVRNLKLTNFHNHKSGSILKPLHHYLKKVTHNPQKEIHYYSSSSGADFLCTASIFSQHSLNTFSKEESALPNSSIISFKGWSEIS